MGQSTGLWRKALIVSGLVPLVMLVALVVSGRPAGAILEDPDTDTKAAYTYTVNPEEGVIEVRIDLAVTADKPRRTTATMYYDYYFAGYGLAIPTEAQDLAVTTSGGTPLSFERETIETVDELVVNFASNIFYRQTANVTVTFSLGSGKADSDNFARANSAYSSFAAWPTPNVEESSITIIAPSGFEDRSDAPVPFEVDDDGDVVRLTAEKVDAEDYFAIVSLANDDALEERVVELTDLLDLPPGADDRRIRVLSWPDDEAWNKHVLDGIDAGLPRLAELVGQPWPIEHELTIIESFSPFLNGYSGWYQPQTDTIEVGDTRDDQLLFHELSHVWLNDDLFAERWITEGLADLFAAEAIESIGGERPEPESTVRSDTFAIPLSSFDAPPGPEEERWAYAASWLLLDSIADEIGFDALADIIDDAQAKRHTYPGDGEPETFKTVPDWRQFLDMAENTQGVDEGPITDLIKTWVLSTQAVDRQPFAQRADDRARYFELVEEGDGWAAPRGARRAMMRWNFTEAADLMTLAEASLAERDDVADLMTPTGASLPTNLEQLYENVADEADQEELSAALDETRAAAVEVREAHDGVAADRSMFQRVGLLGVDLDAEADEAIDAFERGRLDQATTEADEVDAIIDGSKRVGILRLAITAGAMFVVCLGTWGLVRRIRARRRNDEAASALTEVAAVEGEDGDGQQDDDQAGQNGGMAPGHSSAKRLAAEVVVVRGPASEPGETIVEGQERVEEMRDESAADGPVDGDLDPPGDGTEGESKGTEDQAEEGEEEARSRHAGQAHSES